MNYLGIDWGEKRIGLALAEAGTNIALPFKTVERLEEVLDILKEENIDEIIIGNPIKMSGEAQLVDSDFSKFLNKLKNSTDKNIHLIDERLSSLAADALEGHKNEKVGRDEIAAMLILNTYLEQLN